MADVEPTVLAPGPVQVLLVEDDDRIAEPLAAGLGRYGFSVARVATGAAALEHGGSDIVPLDLGLPDIDGIDVCRLLRDRSTVPIIMLTARSEESDRVVGLERGADDYLPHPHPPIRQPPPSQHAIDDVRREAHSRQAACSAPTGGTTVAGDGRGGGGSSGRARRRPRRSRYSSATGRRGSVSSTSSRAAPSWGAAVAVIGCRPG